ncbi:hypothetical protein HMI54_010196 [Coelomomyces lativittatus]|nr:hypothetical protein HMI54_010196 [Coelomomyces lativittatus]
MLSYHVNQIMQENEAKNVNLIHFSNAYKFIDETQPTVPLYSQLATVYFTGTKFKASTSSSSSHPVSLLFGILRLPHVKTDLLMSLYFPNVTTLLPYHNDLFQLVFSSLRILDWGLFT